MTPHQTTPLSIPQPQTSLVGGVRVSTDAQAGRYGPARQRDDITREAERVGLNFTFSHPKRICDLGNEVLTLHVR
ncbi:hypothetical protein GCM10022631_02430 [Deinococcus rubellus]|uniref:Uncharacterized protein n=1 Tax=Deinococcus rubellus TaxID=1889240 RepID=A0ABY5YM28_9DEIO|nr:hypothetical protein [Deinococcus rubellus]UWX64823.1 hypothetical protein N0D28_03930 [Deinococcus rubellus]